MPIYYNDFDPWRSAAGRIADGMIAVNNAKARQALSAQEMAQREAISNREFTQKQPLIDAQVESHRAGARRDIAAAALDEGLEAAYQATERDGSLGQAYVDVRNKQTDTAAIRVVLNASMRASGENPQRAVQTMGELFQIHEANAGNARAAALHQNPASVVNNEADNVRIERMGFSVAPNTVRMNSEGETIGTGLLNIPRGNKIMSLDAGGKAQDVAQGNPVQAASGANPYTDAVKYWNRKRADYITEKGMPQKPKDVSHLKTIDAELASAMQKERSWGGQSGTTQQAAAPQGQPPTDAPTATNPSTGEKLILINGQWQPMKQ